MRQLVLIIIISLLYCNFSYCTIVNITAPDYKNQTLSWKRKIDYITNSFEKIDHTTIDSNGYGKLNYDFKQIELTCLRPNILNLSKLFSCTNFENPSQMEEIEKGSA